LSFVEFDIGRREVAVMRSKRVGSKTSGESRPCIGGLLGEANSFFSAAIEVQVSVVVA
jgi:hypothetical protein